MSIIIGIITGFTPWFNFVTDSTLRLIRSPNQDHHLKFFFRLLLDVVKPFFHHEPVIHEIALRRDERAFQGFERCSSLVDWEVMAWRTDWNIRTDRYLLNSQDTLIMQNNVYTLLLGFAWPFYSQKEGFQTDLSIGKYNPLKMGKSWTIFHILDFKSITRNPIFFTKTTDLVTPLSSCLAVYFLSSLSSLFSPHFSRLCSTAFFYFLSFIPFHNLHLHFSVPPFPFSMLFLLFIMIYPKILKTFLRH